MDRYSMVSLQYAKDKYKFAVADEDEFAKELQELGLGEGNIDLDSSMCGQSVNSIDVDRFIEEILSDTCHTT